MICHTDKPNMSIRRWMSVVRQIDSLNANKFECNGTKSHQQPTKVVLPVRHHKLSIGHFISTNTLFFCLCISRNHTNAYTAMDIGLTFKRHVIICKTMLNAILSIPYLRFFGERGRERRVHFDLFVLVRLFCVHVAFHRLAQNAQLVQV